MPNQQFFDSDRRDVCSYKIITLGRKLLASLPSVIAVNQASHCSREGIGFLAIVFPGITSRNCPSTQSDDLIRIVKLIERQRANQLWTTCCQSHRSRSDPAMMNDGGA